MIGESPQVIPERDILFAIRWISQDNLDRPGLYVVQYLTEIPMTYLDIKLFLKNGLLARLVIVLRPVG